MQARSRGDPVPRFIADEPNAMPEADVYIKDWIALSSCRTWTATGAPLTIPWTAIDAYATRRGYCGIAFDEFEEAVAACEQVFLEHVDRSSVK